MEPINLALPKGRMAEGVLRLMEEAGFKVQPDGRNYRPLCADPRFRLKLLKPQDIVRMVELGRHDLAFAGHDWVEELGAQVDELLDTGLDRVRIVAAAPREAVAGLRSRRIVVASEYERITRTWLDREGFDYLFVRSHGATEVFPPEDADMIVDNTATGRTLEENGLQIVGELLTSSTRVIASPSLGRRDEVDEFVLLLRSVLDARKRVMLEMNVSQACLDAVLGILPCMRMPTVMPLAGDGGYAVKSAVLRKEVARLIPVLKAAGATDILEFPFSKVVS
ncbi:ATP phosphoribosyltransferase [Mesoterricola sediminis]|uniref:ATP phosphoribosyltransferase n=1 Tax=Mesoterricola sediminis TaxID=2927980 RepID=A0AA48KB87_9BACT|nr:ATP phosphoribosyltransferase [Mesoterricola sediminis]BDU75859.1 ATP phosphoribosyltransferase [Mesoterricola sediminis]